MDPKLVQNLVSYHGNEVLDLLEAEHELTTIPVPSVVESRPPDLDSDAMFKSEVTRFLAKKADLILKPKPLVSPAIQRDREGDEYYSILPPLETFMEVSSSDARNQFYKVTEKDDIVVGVVSAMQESGLVVTLLSLDNGKVRDIDHLRITVFCPLREMPRLYAHESPLEAFAIKDLVRGIVLDVSFSTERIIISMMSKALLPGLGHIKMGLISEDDLPIHYRKIHQSENRSYTELLTSASGYNNPSTVSYMCGMLGLSDDHPPSIMREFHQVKYQEADYAESLRKAQSAKWALKSVETGINYFKEGSYVDAMQHFNKALQIDPEHVEALVARGALFANNENYEKAMSDFETALGLNPRHPNARKYMCETLVVHGRLIEDIGRIEDAVDCFERALSINPNLEEARNCLYHLRHKSPLRKSPHRRDVKSPVVELDDDSPRGGFDDISLTLRKLIKEDKEDKVKSRKKRRSSEMSGSKEDIDRQYSPGMSGYEMDENSDRDNRKHWHGTSQPTEPLDESGESISRFKSGKRTCVDVHDNEIRDKIGTETRRKSLPHRDMYESTSSGSSNDERVIQQGREKIHQDCRDTVTDVTSPTKRKRYPSTTGSSYKHLTESRTETPSQAITCTRKSIDSKISQDDLKEIKITISGSHKPFDVQSTEKVHGIDSKHKAENRDDLVGTKNFPIISSYECHVCHIRVDGPMLAEEHANDYQHKKSVKKANKSLSPHKVIVPLFPVGPSKHGNSRDAYYCKICSQYFNSIYWAAKHSEKHCDKRAAVMCLCKVCQRMFEMNSRYEVDLHMNGFKHKKRCQVLKVGNVEPEECLAIVNEKAEPVFYCKACEVEFATKKMKKHRSEKHHETWDRKLKEKDANFESIVVMMERVKTSTITDHPCMGGHKATSQKSHEMFKPRQFGERAPFKQKKKSTSNLDSCFDKQMNMGVEAGLKDGQPTRRGRYSRSASREDHARRRRCVDDRSSSSSNSPSTSSSSSSPDKNASSIPKKITRREQESSGGNRSPDFKNRRHSSRTSLGRSSDEVSTRSGKKLAKSGAAVTKADSSDDRKLSFAFVSPDSTTDSKSVASAELQEMETFLIQLKQKKRDSTDTNVKS